MPWKECNRIDKCPRFLPSVCHCFSLLIRHKSLVQRGNGFTILG